MAISSYNPFTMITNDDDFYYHSIWGHLRLFWGLLAGSDNKSPGFVNSPMGILEYAFVFPAIMKWIIDKVGDGNLAMCCTAPFGLVSLLFTCSVALIATLVLSPVIFIGHLFIKSYVQSQEKKLSNMKVIATNEADWMKLMYGENISETDNMMAELATRTGSPFVYINSTRLQNAMYNVIHHNEKQVKFANHTHFSEIMKDGPRGYFFYQIWDNNEYEARDKKRAELKERGAAEAKIQEETNSPIQPRLIGVALYQVDPINIFNPQRSKVPVLMLVPSLENAAEFRVMQEINFLGLRNCLGRRSDMNAEALVAKLLTKENPYNGKQAARASYLYFFHALNNALQSGGISPEIHNAYHPLVTTHVHEFLGVEHAMTATELAEFRNQEALKLNFPTKQEPTTLNVGESRTGIDQHLRELAAISSPMSGRVRVA